MRSLIFNLHRYTALVAGIFVLVLGVTGSIMAFEDDLDALFHPSLFTVQPGAHHLPIARILENLKTRFPGQNFNGLHIGSRRNESYYTSIRGGQVFVDPYTGSILGTRRTPSVLSRIHQLHLHLLMGRSGAIVVTTVGVILVWLVLSGIYLWWPVKRARIKLNGTLRRAAFDIHNAVGIYSAIFLLAAGATGVVIHFDGEVSGSLNRRAQTKPPARMLPSTPLGGLAPINPNTAIVAALNALPGTATLFYNGPVGPRGSYYVALHFPEDLTPGGRSWVVVDQYSGQPLSIGNSRSAPTGTWTVNQNRAIHTGDIGGYPTKILMSLSCLMLIVQALTCYYMWLKKMRPGSRDYL